MKATYIIPFYSGTSVPDLYVSLASLSSELKHINQVILVCDGGSPDSIDRFSLAIDSLLPSSTPLVILYLQRNVGPGLARNAGVLFAPDGPVFFLDSGDRVISGRTTIQLAALLSSTVSYGPIVEINNLVKRFKSSPGSRLEALNILPFRNPYNNVTLATYRSFFLETGGYPDLRTAEDWVLSSRILLSSSRISVSPCPLVIVDVSGNFISRRSGPRVVGNIVKALLYMRSSGAISVWKSCVSIFLQVLLRSPPLSLLLPCLYSSLRSQR